MNNEPVAWMMKAREPSLHSPDYITFETPSKDMKVSHHPYALYTNPVKELTDEEIRHIQAICHLKDVGYDNFIMRFARAILRKAK